MQKQAQKAKNGIAHLLEIVGRKRGLLILSSILSVRGVMRCYTLWGWLLMWQFLIFCMSCATLPGLVLGTYHRQMGMDKSRP